MSGRVIWYPTPGSIRFTDVGRVWSDIQEEEFRDELVLDNAYGCRTSVVYAAYRRVAVRAELIGARSVAREFEALANWLRSRGTIAVAENSDCFIGGLVLPPAAGATSIQLTTQPWAAWGLGLSFAAGDTFVLKSCGPRYLREEVEASAWDGTTLTLSSGCIFDYADEPFVWIHQKEFHPFLRLRADGGGSLVSHDRRITWTFDLPLEEVPIVEDALVDAFAGP